MRILFPQHTETGNITNRCGKLRIRSNSQDSKMTESKQLLIQEQTEPQTGADDSPRICWKPPRRYIVAFLSFLGFVSTYTLRVNLSIAIISMEEEFEVYRTKKGVILSAFFYGYIFTQIPGGWIAKKYGGKKVFGFSVLVASLLCIITPLLAFDYQWIIAIRFLQGLAEGSTYPSMHSVWSKWAPAPERSRLATISFSGSYIGIVIALLFSGFITESYGWKFIFYIFGITSFLWSLVWLWNVGEDPNTDIWIGSAEKEYINSYLRADDGLHDTQAPPPWVKMLTSRPVWAINIAHFAENWGFYTLLTLLPTYMKDILHFTPKKAGLLSSIPYLLLAIVIQLAGQLADQLLKLKSTTFVRKLFTCSAFTVQMFFILVAGQLQKSDENEITAITCLILAVSLGGFSWAGFSINHLDISLTWASILMGISNTFGTIPGMISPILASHMTSPNGTPSDWTAVFTFSAAIYLLGAVFYGLLASGEEQEWSRRQFSMQESDDSNDESE